jgi:hypothetical protein
MAKKNFMKMRLTIKKLLKKYDYPPEGHDDAIITILTNVSYRLKMKS